MAFVNFYLIAAGTGSADINAGSSIGAAQAAATTGGAWVGATNTFTAVSGTPFAATVAGDYASIYADGATVTTYVAKVQTVTSNKIIVLDGTIKYGTVPADGAANRSCVINGSWNSEIVLAATGLGTTTVPQSTKINIKGNLTTAASRTISMAGATTTPLWFSGYNTTPGDLDNDTTNTLAKPIWTLGSTFSLTCSGNYQTWSSLSLTGTRNGTLWIISGTPWRGVRCRIQNTNASSNAQAISTNSQTTLAYCWAKSPTTATGLGVISCGNPSVFIGVIAEGGGLAGFDGTSGTIVHTQCIALNNTGIGFQFSTGSARVLNCTVLSSGACTDGVKFTGTPTAGSVVAGLLVAGPNGGTAITNGINNASGTNTANLVRACNDYYNVTNAEVGMGDQPAFFAQTDSSFPLVSATNLTVLASRNARNNGFPGIFENETFNSYLDIGAVRHQDAAGLFLQ